MTAVPPPSSTSHVQYSSTSFVARSQSPTPITSAVVVGSDRSRSGRWLNASGMPCPSRQLKLSG